MRRLAYLPLAAILGLVGCGAAGNPQAETAAVAAAEGWLSLIDDRQYAEAWEQAAQLFKGAVQNEQWVRTMETVRKPLGKTVSRELKSKQYRTTVPGAPDGEYVVIQFTTSFENKKSAVETITPMLDPDGQWRVSGYFIK
jgi:Protein of unknown function (DUF4019)